MAETQTAPAPMKINVGGAFDKLLGQGRLGSEKVMQVMDKFEVSKKVSGLREHPVAQKVLTILNEKSTICLTLLGFILVLQGAQFKNILLCTQVIVVFYTGVKNSIVAVYKDFTVASDKISADAPTDEHPSTEDKNKHAAKRDAKKADATKAEEAESLKDASAAAKKALKSVSAEKIQTAAFELFVCAMACLMVIRGGLATSVAVSHALVKNLVSLDSFLDWTGHEEMKEWTDLVLRAFLYTVFIILSIVMTPLAIAINASTVGARLLVDNGLQILEAKGKIADAKAFAASEKGLFVFLGLAAFGSLWQLWNWMAGGGLAWYFQMLYLPAVAIEGVVSLF